MKTLGLIFLLSSHMSFATHLCHPAIDPRLPQYIVGYGSLIDEQSKKYTDPHAQQSLPVLVKGYQRSWSVYGNLPGLNATFLAVYEAKQGFFNGIIFKLGKIENIQHYDQRETVYCRQILHADTLYTYTAHLPKQKQVWLYLPVQKRKQPPSKDYPIVQSYVDTFIRGCIQIEEKFDIKNFAATCILSTDQWSPHWINDRIFPRRPSFYEPYAAKIDALLKKNLADKFAHITTEDLAYTI